MKITKIMSLKEFHHLHLVCNTYMILKHAISSLISTKSLLKDWIPPISMSDCLFLNLFHKSNTCNRVLSYSRTVLLLFSVLFSVLFSLKNFQALAGFMVDKHRLLPGQLKKQSKAQHLLYQSNYYYWRNA